MRRMDLDPAMKCWIHASKVFLTTLRKLSSAYYRDLELHSLESAGSRHRGLDVLGFGNSDREDMKKDYGTCYSLL